MGRRGVWYSGRECEIVWCRSTWLQYSVVLCAHVVKLLLIQEYCSVYCEINSCGVNCSVVILYLYIEIYIVISLIDIPNIMMEFSLGQACLCGLI